MNFDEILLIQRKITMKIAIVGATGEVGRMMLECLHDFDITPNEVELFASAKSAGTTLYFADRPVVVQELSERTFDKFYDYVFFAAGGGIALAYAPLARKNSTLVIDNSSAFREDKDAILVIPQINGDLLKDYSGIVANPNCSTIQMLLPLAVLDEAFTLKKVVVSTYQSVSGSGREGVETLESQRAGSKDKGIYPAIIDLNVVPHIGVFYDDGYSAEEHKMRNETRRILRNDEIAVCATTVRVPVYYGHSNSVYCEFEKKVDLALASKLLKEAAAIDFKEDSYMTPLKLGFSNLAHVSRLRQAVDDFSLCFWNVGHNVRIGAAANAVSILKRHLVLQGEK